MIARYAGTCATCNQPVNVGDAITWSRKHKGHVLHISCPTAKMPSCPIDPLHRNIQVSLEAYRDKGSHYCNDCSNWFNAATEWVEDIFKVPDYNNEVFLPTDNAQATITTKPLKLPASNGHSSEPVILDDLSAVIAQAIARHLPQQETTAQIDESAVRAIVAAEMQSLMTPTIVTVARVETGETKDMGVQHKQFPLLLQVIASGCNVWMSGPAGSGKTTAADNASQALDKKFYFCGAQSNEYGLLGFRTATGELVRTPFREAYEHGGVFLFDEIDASAPTALLAFNAALANGWCAFPDGMIRKHNDFIVIAAANTFGLGGTNDYVGRMKQDAAFIDRFVFMAWDVDESLESSTCGNTVWAKRVQKIRAKIKAKGIKCIVSPRASYYGAKLLAQGIDQDTVETLVLRKGLDQTTWESVN